MPEREARTRAKHPAAVATFAVALVLLVLNDRLLKAGVGLPYWLTGKLSDFAGLVVGSALLGMPLRVFTASRARSAFAASVAVGLGFSALKLSPAAAAGFDEVMSCVFRLVGTGLRSQTVADPTDLIALPMLALGFSVGRRLELSRGLATRGLLCCAAFACLGTSAPPRLLGPHWRFGDDGAGDVTLRRISGGVLEARLGRTSVEGSFELGVLLYTGDTAVTVHLDRTVAWLADRHVRAGIALGDPRVLAVGPRGSGAARVHFLVKEPPVATDLEDFEYEAPRAGHIVIPVESDLGSEAVKIPLAFGARYVHLREPIPRFELRERWP